MLMPSGEDIRNGVVIHAKEQTIQKTGFYKNSVEHKYTYSGVMYQHPAWGFSSPKDHIGVYLINPSTEYIGGGAEKLDLNGPCAWGSNNTIQVYWTSGHYGGGANTDIPAGEDWNRVVGPIFVYFNSIDDPKDPIAGRPRQVHRQLWQRLCWLCPRSGMTTLSHSGMTQWRRRRQ